MAVRTLDSWREQAACRGPETALFYPPATVERREVRDARERRAKAICRGCAVQGSCLEYAVGVGEAHGIWGGLNESERRGLIARNDH